MTKTRLSSLEWPDPDVSNTICWVYRRAYPCECPACHRPPWAVIAAWQSGAAIGRRVVVNHDARRPIPEVADRLHFATKVRYPSLGDGVDPDRIEVGTRDGIFLLNPISDILVELTPEEYSTVRYFPCGPYMSMARWDPPRVELEVTWPIGTEQEPTPEFHTVPTSSGDQFAMF